MRFTFFRRSASKPYHERLRALSLFRDLSSKELDIVSDLLHEREYLEHEVLFDEGEEGHAIYIIVSGHVLICRNSDPKKNLIADLGPGSFFGELALLRDVPRTASVVSLTDVSLWTLDRDGFLAAVAYSPQLVQSVDDHARGHYL